MTLDKTLNEKKQEICKQFYKCFHTSLEMNVINNFSQLDLIAFIHWLHKSLYQYWYAVIEYSDIILHL